VCGRRLSLCSDTHSVIPPFAGFVEGTHAAPVAHSHSQAASPQLWVILVNVQQKHASGRWACFVLGASAGLLLAACSELPAEAAGACDQGAVCRDSDCDFICDLTEGIDEGRDSDGDGMPDYLDSDSDGDGMGDRDEAGDEDRATPPFDRDKNGIPDYLDPNYPLKFQPRPMPDATTPEPDASASDAGSVGLDAGSGPTHPDDPYSMQDEPAWCRSDLTDDARCTSDERGDMACDGLDNDCDGRVDNGALCACELGAARSCFSGPYGRREIGACRPGVQHCVGEELAHWGPCEGGIGPSAEQCDGIDNDCDGCSDERSDCKASVSCPAPGDPRVPSAMPFVPYLLDARRFYAGPDAIAYHFAIRGSPCDRMFQRLDPSADAESGKQSYVLEYANSAQAQAVFTLSGTYTVELTIITTNEALRCTFDVQVRGPGVRVELCWDKTGPSAQQHGDAVDLDLHLAKLGTTAQFETANDCYWQTCRGATGPWGYPNTTQLSTCTGPTAQNFATYSQLGFCPNPRLDADNRLDGRSRSVYITENINLDVPNPADRFRVAVLYKANVLSDALEDDAGAAANIDTRVWVNVFCEGDLLGTFGGDPEQPLDPNAIRLSAPGMLWRVADVAVSNAGCEISALRDPSTQRGYWITNHDFSYGEP
jgi:hypothetical protein